MDCALSKKPPHYYENSRPEMLKYAPSGARKFLDIGCGEGIFGKLLKQKFNAEVWGIEIDNAAAENAKNRIDKVLNGDIMVALKDVPKDYFDCIYFNDVLEHLVDPFSVLKNVKKNLQKNGVVVYSIPNVRYFFNLYNLLIKNSGHMKLMAFWIKRIYAFLQRKVCKICSGHLVMTC